MNKIFTFLTVCLLMFAAGAEANVHTETPFKDKQPSSSKDNKPAAEASAPAVRIQTSPSLKKTIQEHIYSNRIEALTDAPADGGSAVAGENRETLQRAWTEGVAPMDGDVLIRVEEEKKEETAAEPSDDTPETPLKDTDTAKKETPSKTNNKNPTVKVNVQLRNQNTDKNKKAGKSKNADGNNKKIPAAVVKLPPPKPVKPVLSRRQVLENEIRRERAALRSAKLQLSAAQKNGNSKLIMRLNNMIRDRELNIQAIEKEMK